MVKVIIGDPIHFRGGYKYTLSREWIIDLNLFLPFPGMEFDVLNDYVHLEKNGVMHFAFGYAWDGCSGPTIDDDTNMRGGLAHDGGYQLMREGLLPLTFRDYFDKILKNICLADGMEPNRAWVYHQAVDKMAVSAAAKGQQPYPEQTAPTQGDPLKRKNTFAFGPPGEPVE